MGQLQLVKEARHTFVEHSDAVSTGGLRKSTGQPGFADATGAGNDQAALVGDPFAGKQTLEQRSFLL